MWYLCAYLKLVSICLFLLVLEFAEAAETISDILFIYLCFSLPLFLCFFMLLIEIIRLWKWCKKWSKAWKKEESDRQLLDVPLTLNVRPNILSPPHILQAVLHKHKTNKDEHKENLSTHGLRCISFSCVFIWTSHRCTSVNQHVTHMMSNIRSWQKSNFWKFYHHVNKHTGNPTNKQSRGA